MSIIHLTRIPDSHFAHSVSHIKHTADNVGMATPDGCWDLVILRHFDGQVTIFRTGMLTRAIPIERMAGDELLTISFKANIFMPALPARQLVDRVFSLPTIGKRGFYIDGSEFEIPSFENIETFLDKLMRKNVLSNDEAIETALKGESEAMPARTLRRHFLSSTGVTKNYLQQITRAQQAMKLLQQGVTPDRVAGDIGYFDQAHMTKTLKQMMGQTPGEIIRKGTNTTKDLSLL